MKRSILGMMLNEALNERISPEGDYWILNKSGLDRPKMRKLAQSSGVTYNNEWWLVSGCRLIKKEADEMYAAVKDNPNFALVTTKDIQILNGW